MLKRLLSVLVLFAAIGFAACKHETYKIDVTPADDGNFPPAVAKILVTKCATSGCHNAQSYQNANGLLMDSWEHLFDGGNSGAVVVAYSIDNSSLLQFVNTDPSLGPIAPGTPMPQNAAPLTTAEYMTLRDWIASGAPDKNGNRPFSNSEAQKIYVTQQGCDQVAVIDAEKKVVSRYISVGKANNTEAPHCLRVGNDGNAYVSFTLGSYVQKIDTRIDAVTADLNVGNGSWNVFALSSTGEKMMLSDWSANGKMVAISTLNNMNVTELYEGSNAFHFPHGIASNTAFDTFYVTSQQGNTVYKFGNGFYNRISINNDVPGYDQGTYDPHEIMMTPDHSKYFLTCESSNDIRVMLAHAPDTLLKVIPVGTKPQEMAMSLNPATPYLFVTCMEDVNKSSGDLKGSVYVINYKTLQIVKRIDGDFYQPHGITVDDQNGVFYVVSRNFSTSGPAPHHSTSCQGRNGWYSVYNISTLDPLNNKRYEISVDPYSADVRFK
jgi:DNA-binding beta-propeller fold protein YncE